MRSNGTPLVSAIPFTGKHSLGRAVFRLLSSKSDTLHKVDPNK